MQNIGKIKMNKALLLGLLFNCSNTVVSADKPVSADQKRAELLEKLHNVSKAKKLARTKNKGFIHEVCHEAAARNPHQATDTCEALRALYTVTPKSLRAYSSGTEKIDLSKEVFK